MYFQQATTAHVKGDLITAKRLYLLELDHSQNNRSSVLFNLGMLELSQGNFLSGAKFFEKTLELTAGDMACFANAAICYEKIGDYSRAIQLLRRAHELEPNNIQLLLYLAQAFFKQGNLEDAINEINRGLAIDPGSVDLLTNGGIVLTELGRHLEALQFFERILSLDPENLIGLAHSAMALMELTKYQESLATSNKTIELAPAFAKGYLAKAMTLHKLQNFKEALDNYQLALKYDDSLHLAQINATSILISEVRNTVDFSPIIQESEKSWHSAINLKYGLQWHAKVLESVPFFRLKHDLQQAKFLELYGHTSNAQKKFIETTSDMVESKNNYQGQEIVNLTGETLRSFLDYSTERFIYKMPVMDRSLLNLELDWHAIQDKYRSSEPEIVYIDNFLNQEALIAFQQYCLFSKVWHKEYKGSYLGAFANQGFISQLHLKLALDLREAMPNIFFDYPLGQLWGFKYDSQLGTGINVHADFAKVNLNFWITPTESNLDLDSGGLRVYTVGAPKAWTFHDYNKNSTSIYEFLDRNKSESVTIPYRGNRAVLFNSALFHETDEIHFKEGYENRRINLTYLFGGQLA